MNRNDTLETRACQLLLKDDDEYIKGRSFKIYKRELPSSNLPENRAVIYLHVIAFN